MTVFLVLGVGVAVVVGTILVFRLHAFLALVLGAVVVAALTSPGGLEKFSRSKKHSTRQAEELARRPAGERVARAFGETAGGIAVVIGLASIIGQCLLESGGADRIVRSTVRLLGEGGAPIAFAVTGFILGIPVFFDTVFFLMIPLGKALAARTGRNYALLVMTIAAGATISHSLVPPTPGPLYVAQELGVMTEMIVAGIIIGALSVVPGVSYAYWSNRRWPIPLREAVKVTDPRDDRPLPPLWLSLVPIFLPVALIVGNTVLEQTLGKSPHPTPGQTSLLRLSKGLGDANIALGLAAAVAIAMQLRYGIKEGVRLSASLEGALSSAGQIILITCAGGAFGGALQQTGISEDIRGLFPEGRMGLAVLPAAFLVTALVRAAQGSATVAMVTSIGMFAGMAHGGQLGFHPVYLALAIGFGSKPLPWMNDSGFWVVCKMTGQTVGETLRNHTVMFTIMGFTGIILTVIAAALFPLAGPP